MPKIHMVFRKQNEGRMPPEVYKAERLSNLASYNPEEGCKLLKVEMAPKDWGEMCSVFSWLEEKGGLHDIARRAALYEPPSGKPETSDIIELQRNMSHHLRYAVAQNYEYHGEIATVDKLVEARYVDGRVCSPKFISLRYCYMALENPSSGKPLLEGLVPIPS